MLRIQGKTDRIPHIQSNTVLHKKATSKGLILLDYDKNATIDNKDANSLTGTARLLVDALNYQKSGYSVLPVNKNKLPKIQWKILQSNRANADMIQAWHDANLLSDGIGIVTGEVSNRLIVLDFDDYAKADDFIKNFSWLANTKRVSTKRGIHFYYHLAADAVASTRKLDKLDIQYNGAYVVAAPTENYQVLSERKPLTLSQGDYKRIVRHFGGENTSRAGQAVTEIGSNVSLSDILAIYRQISQYGRNEALFKVGCIARDNGYYPLDLILGGLQDAFVHDSKVGKSERPQARMREYTKTIKSVYSRQPRQVNYDDNLIQRVTDDAREQFNRAGLSSVIRVIDALILEFGAGAIITLKDMYQKLAGVIDWKVIRAAMDATFDRKLIFERRFPSPRPIPSEATLEKDPLKIAFSGVTKTEKTKTGRKATFYLVPSPEFLQRISNAQKRASTAINRDDLSSPKSYRAKLTQGIIERTQHYLFHANSWLARCVGVAKRTVQRYLKDASIFTVERFATLSNITLWNVQSLNSLDDRGLFLSDFSGKKYPAKLNVALRLLACGKQLMLRKQGANKYSIQEPQDKPASKQFTNDLDDLMQRYQRGIRGDNLNSIQRQERDNPQLASQSAAYWQAMKAPLVSPQVENPSIVPEIPRENVSDKESFLKQWSDYFNYVHDALRIETYKGITGIPEPSEKALRKRQIHEAQEDAKTLTMLMPNRELSHSKACELIVQFGSERCLKMALKINMEYQLGQDGKRPIKNPVGVLIYRLKGKQ